MRGVNVEELVQGPSRGRRIVSNIVKKNDMQLAGRKIGQPVLQMKTVSALVDVIGVVPQPGLERKIRSAKIMDTNFVFMVGYGSLDGIAEGDDDFGVRGVLF